MVAREHPRPLQARLRNCAPAGMAVVAVGFAGCGDDDAGKSQTGPSAPTTAAAQLQAPIANADVRIGSFRFLPKTVTVKAGGTVKFTNFDVAPHTATADDGLFDTKRLALRDAATQTFEKPGTYPYYCVFHRFMVGTVVVK